METTPYEVWHGAKPKLSFLKVWGCEAYVKKLQPDKLEPKLEMVMFIVYPRETVGYTFYHQAEGKTFVARNGTFLEKEFLAKGVSGKNIDLDEIVDPELEIPSDAMETVREPSFITDEVGENVEEAIVPRRSGRTHATPEWYGNLVCNVMLVEQDEPTNYKEAMEGPESEKWLEAMKSEIESMYDNKVWTLVEIPEGRKAVENKWIFKKKD